MCGLRQTQPENRAVFEAAYPYLGSFWQELSCGADVEVNGQTEVHSNDAWLRAWASTTRCYCIKTYFEPQAEEEGQIFCEHLP